MATGSCASASAVFMRMPSTPCSMVTQASDAVPTPASTMTGHREPALDRADAVGIDQAEAAADRRGQRHDRGAAGVLEPEGGDQVVVGVGEHLEAFAHQRPGGREQALGVRAAGSPGRR